MAAWVERLADRIANEEVLTVCYSYRDRETMEQSRKTARDEERRLREERARKEGRKPAPEKERRERELVRA